ncbi:hypothetical protein P691DRAFT_785802 [Macrolepiota fuliginosa MF-IS2]|uniref:Uncharacterized protein n=1 Tax=Macrolepiota fuliginosa MF-IS2 TaxID=1400762 RepID=A0A9P5X5N8_9AGAR|nr:hypothetical protein P691DRAFT_785802 [Macrolepiota fuliginosa MF-IS2]
MFMSIVPNALRVGGWRVNGTNQNWTKGRFRKSEHMRQTEETPSLNPAEHPYFALFNRHLTRLREHLVGVSHHHASISPSTVGDILWSVEEKEAFVHALSTYSRFRPDLIVGWIETKNEVEVLSTHVLPNLGISSSLYPFVLSQLLPSPPHIPIAYTPSLSYPLIHMVRIVGHLCYDDGCSGVHTRAVGESEPYAVSLEVELRQGWGLRLQAQKRWLWESRGFGIYQRVEGDWGGVPKKLTGPTLNSSRAETETVLSHRGLCRRSRT